HECLPTASLELDMTSPSLRDKKMKNSVIIHAVEISTPSSAPVDMTACFGLTNIKSTPLEVVVKPRLPSNLYE
ncbi:cytochrome p450 82a3, partial [Fagus crenata]